MMTRQNETDSVGRQGGASQGATWDRTGGPRKDFLICLRDEGLSFETRDGSSGLWGLWARPSGLRAAVAVAVPAGRQGGSAAGGEDMPVSAPALCGARFPREAAWSQGNKSCMLSGPGSAK